MGDPRCTVCQHPQRAMIDAQLLKGMSQGSVAIAFNLSRSAVGRHVKAGDVAEGLVANAGEVRAIAHSQLLGQAVLLFERTLALLTELEAQPDRADLRVKALREVRGSLDQLLKMQQATPAEDETSDAPELDAAIAQALSMRTKEGQGHTQGSASGSARAQDGALLELLPGA